MRYEQTNRQFVNQADAGIVEPPRLPRSRFNNSFQRLTAFDAGYLVPFLCDELYPGDHVSYTVHPYVRLSTPLYPLFSNQRVDTHIFAVPIRILWENWKKFQGEQLTPTSSIAYTTPKIGATGGADIGSLTDHLGLPFLSGQIDPTSVWTVTSFWHRAYNAIYNEWFRDQNIIDSAPIHTGDGPEGIGTDYVLRRRAKAANYFTTMLPWPQKFTAPTIPLLGAAPVRGIGWDSTLTSTTANVDVLETADSPLSGPGLAQAYTQFFKTSIADNILIRSNSVGGVHPQVYADLAQATGVSINQLRQAWMIQQVLERDARSGTRYTERIKGVWGVTSPDARQQRPEYIGGGQSPLTITAIAQTAPTDDAPLGALGAAGTASGRHTASYAATEHCVVLGIISVRTELGYDQGVHRMFTRNTRLDYYEPSLAQLGEQAVLRQELSAKGDFVVGGDTAIVGYQERWQELRTRYSDATGIMRTFATGTISAWHLYEQFTANPGLSQTFIEDAPPMARVLAAGSLAVGQQYMADIQIDRSITRVLPTYGTPALLGRF